MLRVSEVQRLLFVIGFVCDKITKKREHDFAFCADDLAGIRCLVFSDVKAPGAVDHDIVFKQDLAANMIVRRSSRKATAASATCFTCASVGD